jgi:hypothetical protein
VVGLCLYLPEKALVLSVAEKSQSQAPDRTQPLLPMRPDQVERRSHAYVCHGTTSLFAALDVATGEVTGRCYPRHRHQDFRCFLPLMAHTYLRGVIQWVLDNYSTHKHPDGEERLRHRPRFHLHLTPARDSWMNQGETWVSLLERKAMRSDASWTPGTMPSTPPRG